MQIPGLVGAAKSMFLFFSLFWDRKVGKRYAVHGLIDSNLGLCIRLTLYGFWGFYLMGLEQSELNL